jgi:hypothetical protein
LTTTEINCLSTLFSSIVHDRQLVDDIPVEKLLIHDVPVDIICTPTQVIFTNTTIPKPQGLVDRRRHLCNLQNSPVIDQFSGTSASECRNLLGKIVTREVGANPKFKRAEEAHRGRDRNHSSNRAF